MNRLIIVTLLFCRVLCFGQNVGNTPLYNLGKTSLYGKGGNLNKVHMSWLDSSGVGTRAMTSFETPRVKFPRFKLRNNANITGYLLWLKGDSLQVSPKDSLRLPYTNIIGLSSIYIPIFGTDSLDGSLLIRKSRTFSQYGYQFLTNDSIPVEYDANVGVGHDTISGSDFAYLFGQVGDYGSTIQATGNISGAYAVVYANGVSGLNQTYFLHDRSVFYKRDDYQYDLRSEYTDRTKTDWGNVKQYADSVSDLVKTGTAGGDLTGNYPDPTVAILLGSALPSNSTGKLSSTGGAPATWYFDNTQYCPATTGSSILYGDGVGGTLNVTIGTGLSFSSGTLSATGGGGTIDSVLNLNIALARLTGHTLQIPTLSGLGGVGTSRTLTINGSAQDLSANRTWTVGDALVANPLSQFANTTSAQLRGVLSDETGTGIAYFQGGDIGTPSGGVADNLTGTASGLISGNVITNANLTGDVTSIGNATTIGNLKVVNGMIANSTIDLSTKVTGSTPIVNGGTAGTTAATARANLNIDKKTTVADANYSILSTDKLVVTNAAFTASRTWTLPASSSVNAGQAMVVIDFISTVTSTNTLVIAVQSGEKINNITNGTETITSAGGARILYSNGVDGWASDQGVVRLNAAQTLTNKTLTSPSIGTSANFGYATASTIAGFDGSGNLISMATGTYPNFTEFSYLKGVGSPITTLLADKASLTGTNSFSGANTFTGGVTINTSNMTFGDGINIAIGSTSGIKIGLNTSDKVGFLGQTPATRQGNATDLGTVLSTFGFRLSGGSYPITTNGNVSFTGSMSISYAAKTANYTVLAGDHLINCTANSFTVTLPTAVGISGKLYEICNSGGGTITIATTSSQTFTNVATTPTTLTLLTAAGKCIKVVADGANYLQLY